MVLRRLQSGSHCVDAHQLGADLLPAADFSDPRVFGLVGDVQPCLNADSGEVATGLVRVHAQLPHQISCCLVGRHLGEPTVPKPDNTLHRDVAASADPDREWLLYRKRLDAGRFDVVPLSVKGNDFLAEQAPQDFDLLLTPPPTVVEVLAERLVLDRVPADTNA